MRLWQYIFFIRFLNVFDSTQRWHSPEGISISKVRLVSNFLELQFHLASVSQKVQSSYWEKLAKIQPFQTVRQRWKVLNFPKFQADVLLLHILSSRKETKIWKSKKKSLLSTCCFPHNLSRNIRAYCIYIWGKLDS